MTNANPMTKEFQLDVCLKSAWNDVFSESYKIALRDEFVKSTTPKEHNFKNHVEAFAGQLRNNNKSHTKQTFKKRDVYVVSFGMGTGSEIIGDRPCIIFKWTNDTLGDDVTVIPLTSAIRDKQADKFDRLIPKDNDNKLFQNSYARLRQIRSVSIKRIGKIVGTITNAQARDAINAGVSIMLSFDE